MMKASACVVLMAAVVVLVVAVAVGGKTVMPDHIHRCIEEQKESLRLQHQIMANITTKLCNATSLDACLARVEPCDTALVPADRPRNPDDTLLWWIKTKLNEVKLNVESCASEMNYTNIVTNTTFVPPTSIKELSETCVTLTKVKEQLNVWDDQQEEMVTCVLTKQGILDQYKRCVHGESTA